MSEQTKRLEDVFAYVTPENRLLGEQALALSRAADAQERIAEALECITRSGRFTVEIPLKNGKP